MSSDHPDFCVPTLGPISKESRLSLISTLSNNGTTPLWTQAVTWDRRGKFFPRGCRGHIYTIEVYCRNTFGVAGTLTVYISPAIGLGPTYQAVINLVGNAPAAWRAVTFNVMWNYDSLFVWLLGSALTIQFAYDTGTYRDDFYSADGGATWTRVLSRTWIRVYFFGETAGDVPVSGTLNIIPIPNSSSRRSFAAVALPNNVFTLIGAIEGAGYCEWSWWELSVGSMWIYVYCDGVEALRLYVPTIGTVGWTASSPAISVLRYAAANLTDIQLTMRFEFKRRLEFYALQSTGIGQAATVDALPNLIR